VTVEDDVPRTARVMILTASLYFVIQGAAWHDVNAIRTPALATMILAFIGLISYCLYQVPNLTDQLKTNPPPLSLEGLF
jgi:hypothetical protein